ncbi:iron-sulfur cluster biosynthesis family protein [Cytobacillus spongiae]|uniref:iron-sulfur cluster biosynthesis family protein n=1 Tax=Cytobacillus spongiae TaxID=2901381 RepID=UPI001F3F2F36|nr:iron-sulfur cluster biosynthesis family protein [Cytobacillus spongiae]UII54734.1 iron-sulfur cluster biosynthesis family protein [Cytobacillus spongiae]
MEIRITEAAYEKLQEKIAAEKGYLKLKYDTEGCGCVVSGVTALWFVNELEEDDMEVKTDQMSIYIEKSKQVFLDESMTIDFRPQSNCFQLKSPNQYLNPRMSFVNKISG